MQDDETGCRRPRRSLGFGIERLGLLAIHAPLATLGVLAVLVCMAVIGTARIQSGDVLLSLLRSENPEYSAYQRFHSEFAASERDILVIVKGDTLFTAERLETLRSLHIELQLAEPVASVISILSVPDTPQPDGYAPPLIPEDIPEGMALDQLRQRVAANPLVRDRLLAGSPGSGEATLLAVTLKPGLDGVDGKRDAVQQVGALADDILQGSGLEHFQVGAPIMEVDVRTMAARDRVLFNALGLLVGTLICYLFFRQIRTVAIVTAAPVAALTLTLGLLGWLDVKLSTFLNAILPLVIVITYCDAMHLVHGMLLGMNRGSTRREAARTAVLDIGPACVLTSLTTSLALLSLRWAESDAIDTFAWAAALSTLLALMVVLLLVPALAALWLPARPAAGAMSDLSPRRGSGAVLNVVCARLGALAEKRAALLVAAAVVALVICSGIHFQLRPTFRMSDQVPANTAATLNATGEFGALGMAYPVQVVVRRKDGAANETPERLAAALQTVKTVQTTLARQAPVEKVWSAALIEEWLDGLADAGIENRPSTAAFLQKMPPHLRQRFVNEATGAMLVTGYLPDLSADRTLDLVKAFENDLADARSRHPDHDITVTGMPVLVAKRATRVIDQLNLGLFSAVILVLVLLGLAFRSVFVPLVSFVPNFLPLVAVGSMLAAAGRGLDYSSMVALTVAFGIAVDNAIHFLNRWRIEIVADHGFVAAVQPTLKRVGPVLIATTCVLVLGIGVTLVSELPPTRTFGLLSMTTIGVALAANLLILPASIVVCGRWLGRRRL